MAQQEKVCTHLIFYNDNAPTLKELKTQLENGSDEERYSALRKVILMHQNGEPQQNLLMTIIRYVLPSSYKPLKKLLLYYWEVIDKHDKEGKLLPEMILMCNYLRNDLTHPNEYIRGITLRFLCKIRERELLEPLIKPICQNLEHRHSYVRRNAILAVWSIYQNFEDLIPDAPELVEKFLETESDVSSKRNAFLMLFNCNQERAIRYVRSIIDRVSSCGDIFQLVLLNALRRMCKINPREKSQYLRVISSLMDSKSNAVLYQCAQTLVSLSSSPAAIKASASCYIQLLLSPQSDNNVRLIVLDRLEELKNRYPAVMQTVVMDLLRGLASPSMDIKKKVLQITLDLISVQNVDSVLTTLKKELLKPISNDIDKQVEGEYKKLLVQTFHKCALKFPEVANNVISIIDLIGETCGEEVIAFVRDIVENTPSLRGQILSHLCRVFNDITSSRVYRTALWILGEYSSDFDQVENALNTIKSALSEIMKEDKEDQSTEAPIETDKPKQPKQTQKLNPDGTYATQTVLPSSIKKAETKPVTLHEMILNRNFYLGSVVCSTLTKLGVRAQQLQLENSKKNALVADIMLIMCAIVRKCTSSPDPSYQMDKDTYERICLCLRLLASADPLITEILLKETRAAFSSIQKEKKQKEKEEAEQQEKEKTKSAQPDALLNITQLKGKTFDAFEYEEEDLSLATKNTAKSSSQMSKLNRITQLTGFSDPVYAEAVVTVHQFDILLNVLVVNQSNSTLQNLTLELATVGDLKLCERPQSYTVAPFGSVNIKANIKVSSTETGIIFGNIVYDVSGSGTESNCVILNDIHIDIMDYISPATCDDNQFRHMWFEFEWENKISINSSASGATLRQYLDYIAKATNMKCLTPESALAGDCEFLSANLYAKSNFGEDALANLSIEKLPDGRISGFVRIRSKTQGLALSLGEKITKEQKLFDKNAATLKKI